MLVLAAVCVLLLSGLAIYRGMDLRERSAQNLRATKNLNLLIEEENARARELEEYAGEIGTNAFAAWYAKARMGLISDNEILIRGE